MQMKALSLLVAGCFATAAQADVYISEYIEGSSNNKAIEIYNDSNSPVDLSTYTLNFYFNGSMSANTTINLAGQLAANSVYVVADDGANAEILAKADLVSSSGFFNGDDAIELISDENIIDSIGQVGFDPGSSWSTGGVSTQNATLVRIDAITLGDSDSANEFDPSVEWIALPQDDVSSLGTHKGCCDDDGDDGDDGGDGGDSGNTSAAPMLLTAIFDGPLSGGIPKGVEIYVSEDINDLSVCGIGSANNGGGTDGEEFSFPAGSSASAGDFIYVASETTGFTAFFGFAPTYNAGSALSINGDDAVELFCNDTLIDVYGEADVDGSGEAWEYLDSFAYRVSETEGSSTFMLSDWNIEGPNALDGTSVNDGTIPVGSFEFAAGSLFFSEYIEGSSNNKALEIVNLTGSEVTLDGNYSVEVYFNGSSSPGQTIGLQGSLANRDVFVLANPNSVADILDETDQTSGSVAFNGDDALVLRGPAGEILDVIGTVGEDPGSEWGTGDASTANNTLLRNTNIRMGDIEPSDAFDPSAEWTGQPQNFFDDLGKFGDSDGGPDDPDPILIGQCGDDAVLISAIQGTGDSTMMANTEVVVEASVTLVTPGLEGFFMQEESAQSDGNPLSSEGIFVFTGNSPINVSEGQLVRVVGTVNEFFDKTQITASEVSESCGVGEYAVTELSLPIPEGSSFEALEGMAVSSSQTLTIVNTFTYARFGEVEVANGRTFNPTHLHTPGSPEAIALASSNARNKIIYDDGVNGAPNDLDLNGPLSAQNTLRTGSLISGVSGVMDYGFNAYRIQPNSTPVVQSAERPETPSVEGDLSVASFNVLNLFNGDGNGNGFPTSRGADSLSEYQLQLAKIANAIVALDASVVGLMEIENDGYGADSAIAQLVDALNQRAGEATYSFIDAGGVVGTDQISVGLVYQNAEVTPVGNLQILDESNSIADDEGPLFNTRRNRPSFAQQFASVESGDTFVVNVNHLKSKGSGCGAGDDSADQGNCNGTRTRAANAVHVWLASTFAEEPVFIVGDLNSYAKEDPIVELQNAGYTDLARALNGPMAYSYSFRGEFGSLDYAMANSAANSLVNEVVEWHINADEPVALDYNEEFYPSSFRDDSVYRSSDHDPVIVGFSFESEQLIGDVNGDGVLSFDDYFAIYAALGQTSASPGFNPAADIDNDGSITFGDLMAWYNLFLAQ